MFVYFYERSRHIFFVPDLCLPFICFVDLIALPVGVDVEDFGLLYTIECAWYLFSSLYCYDLSYIYTSIIKEGWWFFVKHLHVAFSVWSHIILQQYIYKSVPRYCCKFWDEIGNECILPINLYLRYFILYMCNFNIFNKLFLHVSCRFFINVFR